MGHGARVFHAVGCCGLPPIAQETRDGWGTGSLLRARRVYYGLLRAVLFGTVCPPGFRRPAALKEVNVVFDVRN